MKITLYGNPITKKNSSQIILCRGRPMLIPSKTFLKYEKEIGWQIKGEWKKNINYSCNIKCVYFMPTKRKVDLLNLMAATMDILVKYGVLEDDNFLIATSHNGSEVLYDKENPRVEIEIVRK
jgi:Holliday junction resolvase RusA-like endonuclease